MSSTTTRFAIPKPDGTDAVADGDDTMRAMADRLDLLLGESGNASIPVAAVDTTATMRVNYARSYATLAPLVPRVVGCFVNELRATTTPINLWVTGEDATGFTLNIRSANTTTRSVRWYAKPGV